MLEYPFLKIEKMINHFHEKSNFALSFFLIHTQNSCIGVVTPTFPSEIQLIPEIEQINLASDEDHFCLCCGVDILFF